MQKYNVKRLFQKYGQKDYIGEAGISQLSHAIQTGISAHHGLRMLPAEIKLCNHNHIVMASLLHDIGQLVALDQPQKYHQKSQWGILVMSISAQIICTNKDSIPIFVNLFETM